MELHRPHATGPSAKAVRSGRLRRRLIAGVLLAGAVLLLALPSAGAGGARPGIGVVQVEGLLDPPTVTLLRDAIADANEQGLTLLVVQIDSGGAVTSVDDIVRAIDRSRVPVVAWVGPSGAEAAGGATLIVQAAHAAYVSQGSDIGPADPVRADEPDATSVAATRTELSTLAASRGRDPKAAAALATTTMDAAEAARSGATDGARPTIGEVIVTLDGKTLTTAEGDVELSTAKVIGTGQERRRQPNQDVVFDSLSLGGQLQHALISPSTAYFLLVAGLALIVFEFFAASVGFAGVVGALAVVGAGYGMSHLPVHWWAIALLVVSAIGFAVDAQVGGLGFWTGVGVVTLVGGSLTLYGGDSSLRPSWWVLVVVCLGTILFYAFAVPSFIRARFSTPVLGREGMVGEMGTAEGDVAPEGIVLVRGARWRARTNRATPIKAGEPCRVVSVLGFVLEVEPETGGAQDYRERARNRRKKRDAEPTISS